MVTDRASALAVTGLRISYGPLTAVEDVSLHVGSGEIVALIGPNGAGKTSILRAIAGELRPRAGKMEAAGHSLTGSAFRHRRRGVAYVPEGHRTITTLSVAQNLAVSTAGSLKAHSPEFLRRRERCFELFPSLYDRRDVAAGQLSGGEQQMLAIASAIMSAPSVLLIDELSLGLAPQAIERLLEAVRLLPADGTSVLLVEQFADRALDVSDRGYVLSEGRVVLDGPSSDLAASGALEKVFLG